MLRLSVKKFAIFATILAIVSNIYSYTYPSLNPANCSWHCFDESKANAERVILENASLFDKATYYINRYINDVKEFQFNSNNKTSDDENLHIMALGDPQIKGVWKSTPYVSRLDTFGNDFYLGHIFKTMKTRLDPSHVIVMGDLFSSQWIPDSEFYNRTRRYMSRLFKRETTLIENIKEKHHDEVTKLYKADWPTWADEFNEILDNHPVDFNFGFSDVYSWDDNEDYLFVNLTGNHDVGYSGDATFQHMARYNEMFGKDNYWIEYDTETSHPWRLVVLNDLLLEGPALQPEFIKYDWEFLKQLSERNFTGSTILVTHVPFYKEEGLCIDPPEFNYYPEGYEKEPYKANLLRSQNHISEEVTNKVFNIIFENNKPGMVMVGHDHEGCETTYNRFGEKWVATKEPLADSEFHLQEITVRSIMGEFHGNTGLLSGHFNRDTNLWEWKFTLCPFSIQHVWWFSKVSAIIAVFVWSSLLLL